MNYSGMTLNERLVVSGLIKEFDKAKKNKDKSAITKILKEVGFDEQSINQLLPHIGFK